MGGLSVHGVDLGARWAARQRSTGHILDGKLVAATTVNCPNCAGGYRMTASAKLRTQAIGAQEPTDGLSTPTVGLSTSTRFSTRTSTAGAHSNRRTRRHTWTAAALTRDSYTTAIQPYTSSQIVVGGGVATGGLPPTTSTSSGRDRSQSEPWSDRVELLPTRPNGRERPTQWHQTDVGRLHQSRCGAT